MSILKITPHKAMTLIWWYSHRDEIDFNPPYQRKGRLWSKEDKAYLVDSIINGFDVPKLYLADFQFGQSKLNSAKLPYAIIDGKQRLEAIFEFFENKFSLGENFEYRKNKNLQLNGLTLSDLKKSYPRVAEDFENASLDIMSVVAEREVDIHEIFVRLNRSKPLTGAEMRNAVTGPVSEFIRMLGSHAFFIENIKFSTQRAAELNAAAKSLLFEYRGKPVATKKSNLDEFARGETIDKQKLELAGRRALDTFGLMTEIFIPKDELLSSAGIVPVYYWFVRNLDLHEISNVREFLIKFERSRTKNRENRKEGLEGATDVFARYDALNRSTNDQQSHVGRYEILNELFKEWLSSSDSIVQ